MQFVLGGGASSPDRYERQEEEQRNRRLLQMHAKAKGKGGFAKHGGAEYGRGKGMARREGFF